MIWIALYALVSLVVLRLAVGHFAYSYTWKEGEEKLSWNDRKWWPLQRQYGDKPPMWFAGSWRGALLAAFWIIVPLAYVVRKIFTETPLYVGNERIARRARRKREHEERCSDVELLP